MIRATFLVKFYADCSKTTNFGRHFDSIWVTALLSEHAPAENRAKMEELLESLIGTVLCKVVFWFFWFIVPVYLHQKLLVDRATDPEKSKDGVDYMTPVCDRINLDLDGWESIILLHAVVFHNIVHSFSCL